MNFVSTRLSVGRSICVSVRNNSFATERVSKKFDLRSLTKYAKKFQQILKCEKIIVTFHKDLCTFIIICLRINT